MTKYLQKSAIASHKKVGILRPDRFEQHVRLEYFEPTAALAPLVAHYFVANVDLPEGEEFVASDVLVQPEVHLILTKEASYIIGPASKRRDLTLRKKDIYAGIRFRVGGFYPFWSAPMTELTDKTIPATAVFPQLTQECVAEVLALPSLPMLAQYMENMLLTFEPSTDNSIERIQAICAYIEKHDDIRSVQAIASVFGISERTMQHMFASRVGVGVKWIILRIRLTEALKYAHGQAKPDWTFIAAQLGYSSQSHFVHDFKKITGVSPGQYAKSIAG